MSRPTTVKPMASSMGRGVAPLVNDRKEFEATGYVYAGRTASQINERLSHMPESDVTVIQAGTCNIEEQTEDECIKELR